MSTVVKIENLSKRYVIGHRNNDRYSSLRDVVTSQVEGATRKFLDRMSGKKIKRGNITHEEFWALKDINLEIQQGDRVGIIGRNGAGKSTLLKVLSRITEPTRGKVSIRGRVASLLEVGTGFHPELSGRENIFLNGAILGMSKSEIKNRFDEIVEFAEVERFLDTPVKRYSSGMYVRLAFSVAAHLDPEILIVDEVLSVGDAAFQKKCLGKMEQVGSEDRTVLFVSHNMGAIQKLCNKGVYISNGEVARSGDLDSVISQYLTTINKIPDNKNLFGMPRRNTLGELARIFSCTTNNQFDDPVTVLKHGERFSIELQFKCLHDLENIKAVVGINSKTGERITTLQSDTSISGIKNKSYVAKVTIEEFRLNPGSYNLTLGLRKGKEGIDHLENVVQFSVSEIIDQGISIESDMIWYGYVQTSNQRWSMGLTGEN